MQIFIRTAALTLALAAFADTASAVLIRGSMSCAEWTRERKAAKADFEKPWLTGYLSGLSSGMNREFWGGKDTGMKRLENAEVYRRIDAYCAYNQDKNIVHAADQFFKERTGLLQEAGK